MVVKRESDIIKIAFQQSDRIHYLSFLNNLCSQIVSYPVFTVEITKKTVSGKIWLLFFWFSTCLGLLGRPKLHSFEFQVEKLLSLSLD